MRCVMLSGGFDFSQPLQRSRSAWLPRKPLLLWLLQAKPLFFFFPLLSSTPLPDLAGVELEHPFYLLNNLCSRAPAVMDETDIMDLTHHKTRKRPRPISSLDSESMHASLKRLPIRALECRDPSLMFALRGDPIPAASLKQNDHSVSSSPTTVMPAQVKMRKGPMLSEQVGDWSLSSLPATLTLRVIL